MQTIDLNKKNICISVTDINVDRIIKKFSNKKYDYVDCLEYRIDYLIRDNVSITDIIKKINKLKSFKKKLIVTIRTKRDGGVIELSKEQYFEYIKKIIKNSQFDLLDIEYNKYKRDEKLFEDLIREDLQKIILSYHNFEESLTKKEYKKIFTKMKKTGARVIKIATYAFTKDDLINVMQIGREFAKKRDRDYVIISMGKKGILSRLYTEWTNTNIVFINDSKDSINSIGQLSYKKYLEMRDWLQICKI